MTVYKTPEADELRRSILADTKAVVETNRADVLTVTLSFQSVIKPERHAWIDTWIDEDAFGASIDLEDWTYEKSWDNAVATIETNNIHSASVITRMWLQGESLEVCLANCIDCKIELR